MGADGGVVYIPVKDRANYPRVVALLSHFWQFLSTDGGSSLAEEPNARWAERNKTITAPAYILGLYGTDRGDSLTLTELEELCDDPPNDPLYALTFDELDLECRTTFAHISGTYYDQPLHRLWFQHFHYKTREATLLHLGPLATMTVKDWAEELKNSLHLARTFSMQTWT